MKASDFGDLVLHHFASVGSDLWVDCGGDSGSGGPICTSPKDKRRSRESHGGHTALVSSLWRFEREPWRQHKTHRLHPQYAKSYVRTPCVYQIYLNLHAKLSTTTPRLMVVTCSVGYQGQQRLASQQSQPPKQTELTLKIQHNVPSWISEQDRYDG